MNLQDEHIGVWIYLWEQINSFNHSESRGHYKQQNIVGLGKTKINF